MNIATKKQSSIDIIVKVLIFQLSYIILDRYGAIYLLSSLAMLFLLYPNHQVEKIEVTSIRTYLPWIIASVGVLTIIEFLSAIGKTGNQIVLGGMVLVPSLLIIPYYLFPLLLWLFNKKSKLYFLSNKRVAIYTLIIMIPFLLSAIVQLTSDSARIMTNKEMIQYIFQFVVGAALGEELFFRGFFYNVLKKITKNYYIAIVISALLFASAHMNIIIPLCLNFNILDLWNLIVVFLLGIVTCIIYERSKSLIPGIVLHICFNGTLVYIFRLIKNNVF